MRTRRNVTQREPSRPGVVRRAGLRVLAVGILTVTPPLALAGPALAGTDVVVTGSLLSVNAGNLADDISVDVDVDGTLLVRNANDTLSTSGACQKVDDNTVRCPATGITGLQASLQGGADTLRNNTALSMRAFLGAGKDGFSGGSGRDIVSGQTGGDTMSGNGGDDVLEGNLGSDSVVGGEGRDICTAEVRESCEG
ncbi:calcium-binding protein [Streptosporangium sp. NPDC002721]|uniref:calcium-binding protein n=1 Tax=Streptosporangium sp. NPDC002721 TaxID=3366188 RepID=UPI00368163B8